MYFSNIFNKKFIPEVARVTYRDGWGAGEGRLILIHIKYNIKM
jgi:hypothetical protein